MKVSLLNIRHQGPVIAALVRTGLGAGKIARGGAQEGARPEVSAVLDPRPAGLVSQYIRFTGGDPSWYRGTVPPHMFPQWAFPLLGQVLAGQPYDMKKVLNGGAEIVINAPIPVGEKLTVKARLADVTETETAVLLRQEVTTGTQKDPEALVCAVMAVVPKKGSGKGKKSRPLVPEDFRELGRISFPAGTGFSFALLTGDFNPIHWIPAAARMSGFKNAIGHGFCTMARTMEIVNRNLLCQKPYALRSFSCRFVRPLTLPAQAGVYIGPEGHIHTAPGKGATPYLSGTYGLRD
ncbi:MAG: MaoC/PaaZ C-terminal domain-containing protein [Thermodesulfobacteriota bacterium]